MVSVYVPAGVPLGTAGGPPPPPLVLPPPPHEAHGARNSNVAAITIHAGRSRFRRVPAILTSANSTASQNRIQYDPASSQVPRLKGDMSMGYRLGTPERAVVVTLTVAVAGSLPSV